MGVSCQLVLEALRAFAPPRFALEHDPTGLQVGQADKTVERVLCCLDLTLAVAEEARDLGAGLVVSHHAVIFRPLKDLRTDRPRGRLLALLLKHDIAVYVPHTALDVTPGGLNDHLASLAGLQAATFLEQTGSAEVVHGSRLLSPGETRGIGRVGLLPAVETAEALANRLLAGLGAPFVRLVADDPRRPLHKVAVLCGDGRSFLDAATFAGADALITGDIDHHTALEARARGIVLIDVGHWASERAAGTLLASALRERLAGKGVEVSVSEVTTQPFLLVGPSEPSPRA